MAKKIYRLMTVDLENDLRSERCKSIDKVGDLLDFFNSNNIKATFFTVSSLLEKHEDIIREISKKHEIAAHSHTHTWMKKRIAEYEIKTSKVKFEEYDFKCQGFRAPGAIITKDHFDLLKKYGYRYDSSLAQFFPGRYCNLNLLQKPFVKQGVLEFPIPTFLFGVNSSLSYYKLFHPVSKLFKKQYMFYLHPWEFLKLDSKGFIKSLLRRNSGDKAWSIFQEFISEQNCQWIGCKDWIDHSTV